MAFPESPIREIFDGLLVLAAVLCSVRGTRRLVDGLRQAVPLEVIRAIRIWCIALAMATLAAGLLAEQTGFLVLGAIFLGEELYETGLVAGIIRSGERGESDSS
jgi:hypothetical protein